MQKCAEQAFKLQAGRKDIIAICCNRSRCVLNMGMSIYTNFYKNKIPINGNVKDS